MPVSINGTNGLVFNDSSTQNTAATGFGFKNRIINGAMMIDQRNAGASVTPADLDYTLDRWQVRQNVASKYSLQQSSVAPNGFINSLLVTSLSSYSVSSTDIFYARQNIEGLNCTDLGFGTANAQTVTLSFWVRSSLTGTFGGSLTNSAVNRSYVFSYTINSANTWEQKTVTIVGDTSGTWLTTNGVGLRAIFSFGVGSAISTGTVNSWQSGAYYAPTGATSVVGTNGATFYITGVQLEKGSTATSFDYRPYGTELALCQRYAQKSTSAIGRAGSTTEAAVYFPYQVSMRATPTATLLVGTNMIDVIYVQQRPISSVGAIFGPAGSDNSSGLPILLNSSSLTNGNMVAVFPGALLFSAEL